MKTWNRSLSLKIVLIISLVAGLLSGCGGGPSVKETFPLESVTRSGNSTSYVYRAANETVPQVAQQLSNQKKPDQISKTDDNHMFLVYGNEYYHLQKDTSKSADTLVEVDSTEYVRNNYDSSFLQGYLTATLIGSLFNSLGGYGGGGYRGYTSRDIYEPHQTYHAPTTQDKKAAPPLTVEKKGSITRRGSSSGTSGSTDSSGLFGGSSGSSGSKGSITRDGSGSSGSSQYSKPRSGINKPSTRSGRGSVSRRR